LIFILPSSPHIRGGEGVQYRPAASLVRVVPQQVPNLLATLPSSSLLSDLSPERLLLSPPVGALFEEVVTRLCSARAPPAHDCAAFKTVCEVLPLNGGEYSCPEIMTDTRKTTAGPQKSDLYIGVEKFDFSTFLGIGLQSVQRRIFLD
jgi:hypothetical protein